MEFRNVVLVKAIEFRSA